MTIKWSNGISGVENKITSGGNYTLEISNGCTNISEPFDIKGPVSTNLFKKYIVCSEINWTYWTKLFPRDAIVYRTVVNALGCVDSTTYDLQFGQKFNYILDITGSCPDKNDGKIFIDMKTQGEFTYYINEQLYALQSGFVNGLKPDDYILKIKDKIGCEQKIDISLEEKKDRCIPNT
ncbi:MAG: hypothetical protein IPO92_16960 [Saprospiraceae bacterium]|nr:hypothetical protein [Saprospiraceae bacterium]